MSADDRGAESTINSADTGKFGVPSLRNIRESAPYIHDGRFDALEDVGDQRSTGKQDNPQFDGSLRRQRRGAERYKFSSDDKTALIAFLDTLTDEVFLNSEESSAPFQDPQLSRITSVVNSSTGGELIGARLQSRFTGATWRWNLPHGRIAT